MIKRKAGRPKGAPNKNRIPQTEDIVKMSKQNFELVLGELYNILIDNPPEGKTYTDKQREMAMRLSANLGQHFVSLEMGSKAPKEDPKDAPTQKEPPAAGNVVPLTLKTFTADK